VLQSGEKRWCHIQKPNQTQNQPHLYRAIKGPPLILFKACESCFAQWKNQRRMIEQEIEVMQVIDE